MADKPKVMNMTERRELRKLVEERFELLQSNLSATEAHIRNAIEERLTAEAAELIASAEEQTLQFKEKAEAAEKAFGEAMREVEKEYMAFVRAQRKLGVEPDTTFGGSATRRGRHRGYNELESSGEFEYISWDVADIDKKVKREFDKVRATKGDAKQALMEKRNEMLTDIVMGVFQSEEARQVLASIPTLDNFIKIEKANEYLEIEGVSTD